MGEARSSNSPTAPGKTSVEVRRQLLDEPRPGLDEVLAGPDGRPQRHRLGGVGMERPQAMAVGAQGVGQDERVGAVVLVARQAVAGAERLDVAGRDDHHPQAGLEQRVDDRAVRPLDGHPLDAPQAADQLPQAGRGVLRPRSAR